MVRRDGEVIPREELYAELSSHSTYDFKHGLNNAIQKIREVLGDSPENARFIETVPGRGYRFLPQVEVVYRPSSIQNSNRVAKVGGERPDAQTITPFPDAAPIPNASSAPEVVPSPDTPLVLPTPEVITANGMRRRWRLWLGAAALIAVVAFLTSFYLVRGKRPTGKVMLMVLPFLNLSNNPDQEYIADGMTEEMITQLSRLNPKRLGVISRTTSMQYKGTHKGAAQIRAELKVNYLREGSIQREGKRVAVRAQLIQPSEQTALWAQRF